MSEKVAVSVHIPPGQDPAKSVTKPEAADRCSGVIKWYNHQKGYGFIAPGDRGDGAEDIFFHFSGCPWPPREGQTVEFSIASGQKGPKAVNIQLVGRAGNGGSEVKKERAFDLTAPCTLVTIKRVLGHPVSCWSGNPVLDAVATKFEGESLSSALEFLRQLVAVNPDEADQLLGGALAVHYASGGRPLQRWLGHGQYRVRKTLATIKRCLSGI